MMDWLEVVTLFASGAAIGGYAGWGLTVLYLRRDDDGDGGTDRWPDYVPDDLVGRR